MNLQQLLVLGRATKNAEVKKTKEGKDYTAFTVMIREFDKTTSEERFSYYNCIDKTKKSTKTASIKVNQLIMVDGRPEADAWLDNDGEVKSRIVVNADRIKIIQ